MYPTYVPILKAKHGEFAALEKLKTAYSQRIIPFFEIPKFTQKCVNRLIIVTRPSLKTLSR